MNTRGVDATSAAVASGHGTDLDDPIWGSVPVECRVPGWAVGNGAGWRPGQTSTVWQVDTDAGPQDGLAVLGAIVATGFVAALI